MRRHYVRWWIERSGLSREQIRPIVIGMWSDSYVEAPLRPASKLGLDIPLLAYKLTHSSDS